MEAWVEGGKNGESRFSVPVLLLLTESGVGQDGTKEGATAAPTAEHEDDNSLGYTGTTAVFHRVQCGICFNLP